MIGGILLLMTALIPGCTLLLFHRIRRNDDPGSEDHLPFVSVLIAARNEETTLGACLQALTSQQYPVDLLEILIGNDASTDGTGAVLQQEKQKDPRIREVVITKHPEVGGKANVLAHLAEEARGEYLFVTDADTITGSYWVRAMLTGWKKEIGIANGITAVKGHVFQDLEWLHAEGMIKVITDYIQPVTAIGNNMGIRREAYDSTGGYHVIPFSLTEDYALFRAANREGYGLTQHFNREVLAETMPARPLKELLQQRKRWMTGVMRLPWFVLLVLFLQGLFIPLVIAFAFVHPIPALMIMAVRILLQTLWLRRIYLLLSRPFHWVPALIFEFYAFGINLLMMAFYILPIRVKWKSREF